MRLQLIIPGASDAYENCWDYSATDAGVEALAQARAEGW